MAQIPFELAAGTQSQVVARRQFLPSRLANSTQCRSQLSSARRIRGFSFATGTPRCDSQCAEPSRGFFACGDRGRRNCNFLQPAWERLNPPAGRQGQPAASGDCRCTTHGKPWVGRCRRAAVRRRPRREFVGLYQVNGRHSFRSGTWRIRARGPSRRTGFPAIWQPSPQNSRS